MPRRASWPDFVLVALAGAACVLGLLSLLVSLLLAGVAAAVVVAVVLVRRRADPRCLLGGLVGAATPLLYVAWLNRGGPGQRCRPGSCEELMNPWPWLVVGVVLVSASIVGFVLSRRDDAPAG